MERRREIKCKCLRLLGGRRCGSWSMRLPLMSFIPSPIHYLLPYPARYHSFHSVDGIGCIPMFPCSHSTGCASQINLTLRVSQQSPPLAKMSFGSSTPSTPPTWSDSEPNSYRPLDISLVSLVCIAHSPRGSPSRIGTS